MGGVGAGGLLKGVQVAVVVASCRHLMEMGKTVLFCGSCASTGMCVCVYM